MTPTVFILILNPLTSAIFAAALLVLWQHQRHLTYIGLLGISFALKSCAYLMQFLTLTEHVTLARLVSNALFMATGVTLVGGLIARHSVRPPYRSMIVISVLTMVVLTFYQVVEENFAARAIALNAGIAVLCAIGAWTLHRLARRTFIERMQVVLLALHVVAAILRPLPLLMPGAPPVMSIDSIYWLGVTSSDIVMSMLLVLCIFTGMALDVFARLRTESIQDSLSGLLNRRGFEEVAGASLASGAGQAGSAALVLADLDHFKSINDSYGHGAGDRVIASFARVLAGMAGDDAVSGRVGGEEFAVLLTEADAKEGYRFAERVRIAFALIPLPEAPRRVTASFGIAAVEPGESLEAAMRRADEALYRAKHEGRDCIRIAGSVPHVVPIARRPIPA